MCILCLAKSMEYVVAEICLKETCFKKISDGLQKLAAIEGIRLPNPRFSPKPKLSTFSFLKMILLAVLSTPPKKAQVG